MKKVGGLKIFGFNIIASIILIGVIWFCSHFGFIGSVKTQVSEHSINTESAQTTNTNSNDATYSTKSNTPNYLVNNSPLKIMLDGEYQSAFLNATNKLSSSSTDNYKKLVAKIGLQILQSNTIVYENDYHYYSLSYTNNAGSAHKQYYSLESAIVRINSGQKIYTDCFGFVRLTFSIACYSVNKTSPQNVAGLNSLYGYAGGFQNTSKITSPLNLNCGTMIADRITGNNVNSTDRHVAIFLYKDDNTYYYIDQDGIHSASFSYSGKYIYSSVYSSPYKFNCFRNFI